MTWTRLLPLQTPRCPVTWGAGQGGRDPGSGTPGFWRSRRGCGHAATPGPQGPPTPASASWPGSPSEPWLVRLADLRPCLAGGHQGVSLGLHCLSPRSADLSSPSTWPDLRGAPGTPPHPLRPAPGPTGAGTRDDSEEPLLPGEPGPRADKVWTRSGHPHAASRRVEVERVPGLPGCRQARSLRTRTAAAGAHFLDEAKGLGEGTRAARVGPSGLGWAVGFSPGPPTPPRRRAPPCSRPGVVSLPRSWAGTRARPCHHGLSLLIKPLVYGSRHHPRRASQVALRGCPQAVLPRGGRRGEAVWCSGQSPRRWWQAGPHPAYVSLDSGWTSGRCPSSASPCWIRRPGQS